MNFFFFVFLTTLIALFLSTTVARPICPNKEIDGLFFLSVTKATRKNVALVAKFLDGKKVENVTLNCFKLHRSYSISFNLSSVGEIFWGCIRKAQIIG